MEGPGRHVCIEISQVRVIGHRLVERLPAQPLTQHINQGGFPHADISGNRHKLLHRPSVILGATNSAASARYGICPASSLSITCWNTLNGWAPTTASPLIKKVGVEFTPRF